MNSIALRIIRSESVTSVVKLLENYKYGLIENVTMFRKYNFTMLSFYETMSLSMCDVFLVIIMHIL